MQGGSSSVTRLSGIEALTALGRSPSEERGQPQDDHDEGADGNLGHRPPEPTDRRPQPASKLRNSGGPAHRSPAASP
jgi:hypothetical protein